VILLVALAGLVPTRAADYFVRAKGNDQASGRSKAAAWRTIERVNQATLRPGDRVRFEGGKSFTGRLRLTAEDAGTARSPVVIGSYGRGRATILAGQSSGIVVESAGGVVIEQLVVTGDGRTNNSGYGVVFDNQIGTDERLRDIRIANVDVSGFGVFGILVTGTRCGFANVAITDCELHDNLRGGMEVAGRLPYDAPNYAHANVRVSHCRAYHNTGDPNYLKNHSGSGIVLYQVDGGVMEYCEAWNNGAECHSQAGGGVGLWTCASRRVVIQNCESFANRTSAADGGGFDLDGGCEECVLQYNYSHDNDGPGLMAYTYAYASHSDRGNIIRFNISENDSRRSRTYAGLWVRSEGPPMTGLEVYNNTVVVGSWCDQAAMVHGANVGAAFRNNIFIASGAAVPLRVSNANERLRFENNLYWHTDGQYRIVWDHETFTDLDAWRKRLGQEMVQGRPTGLAVAPALTRHDTAGRAIEHSRRSRLRAFQPQAGSPVIASGLNLHQLFHLDVGGRDFAGTRLPASGVLPIGAIATPAKTGRPRAASSEMYFGHVP